MIACHMFLYQFLKLVPLGGKAGMKQENLAVAVYKYLGIVNVIQEYLSILPYIGNINERALLLLFWIS